MGLEIAVRSILVNDNDIKAFVADRVRPLEGSQSDKLPYILYEVTIPETRMTHSGAAQYQSASVELSIFTDTYTENVNLSATLRSKLIGDLGTVENVRIVPSILDDQSDVAQGVEPGTEKQIFLRTQTYRMQYREL